MYILESLSFISRYYGTHLKDPVIVPFADNLKNNIILFCNSYLRNNNF